MKNQMRMRSLQEGRGGIRNGQSPADWNESNGKFG